MHQATVDTDRPAVGVDIIIENERQEIILGRRIGPPQKFEGMWSLPGGRIKRGETVIEAAKRNAREEVGLEIEVIKLVGVYSDPSRDPRGHTISLCILGRCVGGKLVSSDRLSEVAPFAHKEIPKLAFDQNLMVENYVKGEPAKIR